MPLRTNASPSPLHVPPPVDATNAASTLQDIHDIRPPLDLRSPWWTIAWIVGLTLLVALLAWMLARWWRSRKARITPPLTVPPHLRALRELDHALRWLSDARLFCIHVSDILRRYLEESLGLRAPERTTEEFLLSLPNDPRLNTAQKQSLALFLEHCDLVKFARHVPPESQLRELHNVAISLVTETSPLNLAANPLAAQGTATVEASSPVPTP